MSNPTLLPEIADQLLTTRFEDDFQREFNTPREQIASGRSNRYTVCESCGKPTSKLLCSRCSGDDYEALDL